MFKTVMLKLCFSTDVWLHLQYVLINFINTERFFFIFHLNHLLFIKYAQKCILYQKTYEVKLVIDELSFKIYLIRIQNFYKSYIIPLIEN